MSSKLLSGEDLVIRMHDSDRSIPDKGGIKDYAPDGSWLQEKKLEHFFKDRFDVLAVERVARRAILGRCEWRHDEQKVQVLKQTKGFWETRGYTGNGKLYLHPEEALFLLDQGSIEISCDGIPWSIQEAFTTLLSCVPAEHYAVYSHLSRYGYIIRRHEDFEPADVSTELTEYEQKINLTNVKKSAKPNKKRKLKDSAGENCNDQQNSSDSPDRKVNRLNSPDRKACPSDFTDHKNNTNDFHRTENNRSHSPSSEVYRSEDENNTNLNDTNTFNDITSVNNVTNSEIEMEIGLSDKPIWTMEFDDSGADYGYSSWNYDDILFPDISSGLSMLVISSPQEVLLPSTVKYQSDNYSFSISDLRGKRRNYTDLEFSHGAKGMKAKGKAKNWAQYKNEMIAQSTDDYLKTTPAGHLWSGDVQPIIKPWEATSLGTVYDKLRLSDNVALQNEKSDSKEDEVPNAVSIIYDVYLPQYKYKKHSPGLPGLRLCISRQDEPPPDLGDIQEILKSCKNVPLKWAVVDNGDICFFSVYDINLGMP